jgi:hypothetical protein
MKLFPKWLLKNAGFSLVETLVAIGISTGAALIVYKVLGESQKGQVLVENRDDVNQFHREVIGKLTDRGNCTMTLMEGMTKGLDTFPITRVLNNQRITLLDVPGKLGKITLTELKVAKVDKVKNEAELQAVYTHAIAGKTITAHKSLRVEMSFKDGQFEGCVSRGTLGLDPKDACDLVVGQDEMSKSYFYNGKCNFAKAACEQSGRVWNEEALKCNFSEDDLESLRKEICSTLGFNYSPETSQCLPSQKLLDAVEEYKKSQGQ